MDLEKLRQDLQRAKDRAIEAGRNVSDGGTCNLDATVLRIPKGSRSAPILRAIEGCGLRAFVTEWLGRGIMICPPGNGQANKRLAANETLSNCLRAAGWQVSTYYQMD